MYFDATFAFGTQIKHFASEPMLTKAMKSLFGSSLKFVLNSKEISFRSLHNSMLQVCSRFPKPLRLSEPFAKLFISTSLYLAFYQFFLDTHSSISLFSLIS